MSGCANTYHIVAGTQSPTPVTAASVLGGIPAVSSAAPVPYVIADCTIARAMSSAANTRPRNPSGTAIWSSALLDTHRIDPKACTTTTTAAAIQMDGAKLSAT